MDISYRSSSTCSTCCLDGELEITLSVKVYSRESNESHIYGIVQTSVLSDGNNGRLMIGSSVYRGKPIGSCR